MTLLITALVLKFEELSSLKRLPRYPVSKPPAPNDHVPLLQYLVPVR